MEIRIDFIAVFRVVCFFYSGNQQIYKTKKAKKADYNSKQFGSIDEKSADGFIIARHDRTIWSGEFSRAKSKNNELKATSHSMLSGLGCVWKGN